MDDARRACSGNAGANCRRRPEPAAGSGWATYNGVATGHEYYLPLFFEQTATVFDHLGADATLVLHGDLGTRRFQRFWQDTRERYRLAGDPDRPAPPETLFRTPKVSTWSPAAQQLALRQGAWDVETAPLVQALPDMACSAAPKTRWQPR